MADFGLSSNTTHTIAAGQTASTGMVTITAINNQVDAPDKTITVQEAVANQQGVTDPANVTLTITDDHAAPTATLLLSPAFISENAGSTTITATLDHPFSGEKTIMVSASPQAPATAADFGLSTNTTLTIAVGQTGSTGVVTITANDNEIDAPDKTITVQGAAANLQGVTGPADVTFTITDDDIAIGTSSALLADRVDLIALYEETGGPNWTTDTKWLNPPEELVNFTEEQSDAWYGVSVSGGRISFVELLVNNLQGIMPSALGNLSNMRGLQLQ